MFLKFLDWATNRGADEERLVAFYHLADGVAGKLKGLFLLFAGHIVKNAASLLERTNIDRHDLLFSCYPRPQRVQCFRATHLWQTRQMYSSLTSSAVCTRSSSTVQPAHPPPPPSSPKRDLTLS
jgi:hypothetical protein